LITGNEKTKIRAAGNLRKQKIVPPRTCDKKDRPKKRSAEKKFGQTKSDKFSAGIFFG
jgi:hypothetical protein